MWDAFDILKHASEALLKAKFEAGTIVEPEKDDDLQSFLKAETIYFNLICQMCEDEEMCDDEEYVQVMTFFVKALWNPLPRRRQE